MRDDLRELFKVVYHSEFVYNLYPAIRSTGVKHSSHVTLVCPPPPTLMEATLANLSLNQTSMVPLLVAVNMKSPLTEIRRMSNPVGKDHVTALLMIGGHLLIPQARIHEQHFLHQCQEELKASSLPSSKHCKVGQTLQSSVTRFPCKDPQMKSYVQKEILKHPEPSFEN
ncbi:hypothetical protein NC653_005206 [Populus alba x Populus x berolinensis]|uniref:Uncharacterized protein n=1 Tax=Populus alba x Populus x berolinensis TaxID=444605 RepID=A0AAD6RBD1_9ROSI|nr:hypothetical protein NC653_005206 [Populus alba x Populus x berolinensis]